MPARDISSNRRSRPAVTSSGRLAMSILGLLLAVPLVRAQDLSRYREFQFGMDLLAVEKQADVKPSEVKMIHQRPAAIQEMEWRPQYLPESSTDPVKGVLFCFYNGELFRMVINYDRNRTEGLTDKDIIEAISERYGQSTSPAAAMVVTSSLSQTYSDSEKVIARWEDPQYSFNLFRSSYQPADIGMVIVSKRLDVLAQAAVVKATLLDLQEAPQREIDRQKKVDEEKRAAGQKVRPVNKTNFRP